MKIVRMYQPSPTSKPPLSKKQSLTSKQKTSRTVQAQNNPKTTKRQRKIGKKGHLILKLDFYHNISSDSSYSPSSMPLPSLLAKSVGNIGSPVAISSRCPSISAISLPKFQTRPQTNARASTNAKRKKFIKMLTSSRQHSPISKNT